MKTKTTLLCLIILLLVQCTTKITQEKPPLAQVKHVEDVYFGKEISDPYRYMEDLQDSVVQNWFKSQADYSRSVLNNIQGRQSLINKMRDFDERKSSKISYLNITENDRYFYLKTTPEDETGIMYYREGYEGEEVFLYDPQAFSTDTTQKYVISGLEPSDDGSKVAFEIAPSGSESSILLTMDIDNKKLYPEKIDRCWWAATSWLPDGSGYFVFDTWQESVIGYRDMVQYKLHRGEPYYDFLNRIGYASDPKYDYKVKWIVKELLKREL